MSEQVGHVKKGGFDDHAFAMMAQPIAWRKKALQLRRAADLLWAHVEHDSASELKQGRQVSAGELDINVMTNNPPDVMQQYLMLAGFSLENLLKARIVALSETSIADGAIGSRLKSHALRNLARTAGVVLSASEEQLCDLLTDASVNSGRYPVPGRVEHVVASSEVQFGPSRRVFAELFGRLDALVATQLLVARPQSLQPTKARRGRRTPGVRGKRLRG